MRLRVKIRNAKECRIELNFPDLCVKYTNGYSLALKVAEGQEIPFDVLDQEDIRKSLKVGSLKGYLDNGWVEEILADEVVPAQLTPLSHFITEQMIASPSMLEPLKPFVAKPETKEVPLQPILPEAPKAEKSKVSEPIVESLTDLSLVKSYEDFNRLSHTLKLRFIKDCTDVALLKDISGKTSSVQFKNNISLRLTQIK